MSIRGIDHVGVTVQDLEAATAFLKAALGAEVLYDTLPLGEKPQAGSEAEQRLHLRPGAAIHAIRMLRLHNGPGIELFQTTAPHQQEAAQPSDMGLQHIALYVDDLDAAVIRFRAAGGEVFAAPRPLPPLEAGTGNAFCYGMTPWGMMVEFVTYPSPQPYREQTALRRWTPKTLEERVP